MKVCANGYPVQVGEDKRGFQASWGGSTSLYFGVGLIQGWNLEESQFIA